MKSYLTLGNVALIPYAAPVSEHPTEDNVCVCTAIFNFISNLLYHQLFLDSGDSFLGQIKTAPSFKPATILRFFKYVEPLREMEFALITRAPLPSKVIPVIAPAPKSKSNSSSSGGIRTPKTCAMSPLTTCDSVPDVDDISVGKKSAWGGLFRKRHSILVRHPRDTPGSHPVSPTVEQLASDPSSPDPKSHLRSKSSGSTEMVMAVPSLEEVLGSTYFRRMITDYYFGRVDEDEANAWDDLTRFYSKYCKYDDVVLHTSQEAIVRHAKNIIATNRRFFGDYADQLEKRLPPESENTVTANFFRGMERALFAKAYELFSGHLVQKGWEMVPITVDDDSLMFM